MRTFIFTILLFGLAMGCTATLESLKEMPVDSHRSVKNADFHCIFNKLKSEVISHKTSPAPGVIEQITWQDFVDEEKDESNLLGMSSLYGYYAVLYEIKRINQDIDIILRFGQSMQIQWHRPYCRDILNNTDFSQCQRQGIK